MLNKKLLGTSSGLPQDDNFENVTLLLNGDGTNGGQNNTFLDSSTNNFTITRNGNTTQGNFSPYGTLWSNYFNGSSDYFSLSSNAAFSPGTGDFCIEAWLYPTTSMGTNYTGVFVVNVNNGIYFGNLTTGFGLRSFNGSDLVYGATLTANTWTHVAVTRSGTDLRIFYNGVQQGSTVTNSTNLAQGAATLGVDTGTGYFPGYISNFRLVKGSAVYTANFTPSTTPLTAITNTSLLTCQSNRFIDNSSNAFALTVNGSPSVQRFSPFEPSAPYSTSVIGGSGYLDGSGDNLSIANNSALNFDTGTFTVEAWFYQTTLAFAGVVSKWPNTGGDNWLVATNGDGAVRFYYNGGNILGGSYPINTWNHVAVSRDSSNVIRLFLNGTQVASVTSSFNSTGTAPVEVGSYASNSNNFTGYISDARVVKGTAVYTSAFTPPTAPLTAITNTSLLCNMTNASIADLAMQNNLETAGNAQVSTSVKKYGTGSLSFDGTGDYLRTPANNFALPLAGNFTIEFWLYLNSTSTTQTIMGQWESPTFWEFYYLANTELRFYYDNTNFINLGALSTGTWYHVAAVRSGSTITAYLNGTSQGTATSSATIGSATKALGFGSEAPWTGFYFNGYLDDVRITNGVARYTSNFTVPASALPTY